MAGFGTGLADSPPPGNIGATNAGTYTPGQSGNPDPAAVPMNGTANPGNIGMTAQQAGSAIGDITAPLTQAQQAALFVMPDQAAINNNIANLQNTYANQTAPQTRLAWQSCRGCILL